MLLKGVKFLYVILQKSHITPYKYIKTCLKLLFDGLLIRMSTCDLINSYNLYTA